MTSPFLRGSAASLQSTASSLNQKVCVFTILFGGFDKLLPPPAHLISPAVDFYVMTDQIVGHPEPWQEFVISPLPYDNPRQNARSAKMLPPDELWNKCDISLQVDANIDFLRSPHELAMELQPHANLGLIRHPFLSNYQSEIDHLCQVYPHDCELYQSHARHHADFDGTAAHQYETSVMIRRHNNETRRLMTYWRDDLFASGHLRDQVALVPMLHAHNADIELYGPGGDLLLKPPKGSKSDDPAIYTKHLQYGDDQPSFIQLYRGHNHDFAKWRCHGKVMGKKRSAMAHTAYCSVYYVTKRWFPWLESLAPVTYNSIKAMDLKDPIKATLVSLAFVLFALTVFFPHSSPMLRLRSMLTKAGLIAMANRLQLGKCYLMAVRLSMLISVTFFLTISYFYTFTMGVACLWPGIGLFAPPIFVVLLVKNLCVEDLLFVSFSRCKAKKSELRL